MALFKVTTPAPNYSGERSGVVFRDGVATVDDSDAMQARALAYFRRRGYGVEPVETVDDSAPETPTVDSGESGGSEAPKPARSSKAVR